MIIRHLKVWQKLVLAGLPLLLLPVLYIWTTYTQNRNNVQVASRELAGCHIVEAAVRLLNAVQQQRVLAAAVIMGATDQAAALNDSQQMVGKLLADLNAASDQAKAVTEGKLDAIHKSVEELEKNTPAKSYEESVQNFTAVTRQLLEFISNAGDQSALFLDSDIPTSYTKDAFMVQIPEVTQDIGRSGEILTHWGHSGQPLGADARDELQRMIAVIGHSLNAVGSADGPRAEKAAPALDDKLKGIYQEGVGAARDFGGFVPQAIGSGKVGQGEAVSATLKALAALDTWTQALIPVEESLLQTRIESSDAQTHRSYLLALVVMALAGIVGFFLIRDITSPLLSTVMIANAVASGNVAVVVPEEGRMDEFGTLQRAMRTMVANLREILSSIDRLVATVNRATGDIIQISSQLAVMAAQVSTSVNQATTTVEEVRVTSHQSSSRAQQVAQTASQAAEVSRAGRQATDLTLQEMDRIKGQVESVAESIVHLSEQTQAIGEIIASVNELAEQSNLLSVNASIEAAKAGEQGRGFAVVAQEVRHLAERSKQSTKQVRSILHDIHKATTGAVGAAEAGTKAADSGVKQSQEAGESIKTLAVRVVEAAQAAGQISMSLQQQLMGIDQVVTAMNGIKESSLQTAESTRQMQQAAQNLHDMGQQLKQLTERYSFSAR
ncbi:MAG TPA: methyl-accepting chemotaxis protein [Candidatus Xenobia bacterium]|jgi:methyl-accepting chemotaxis protein